MQFVKATASLGIAVLVLAAALIGTSCSPDGPEGSGPASLTINGAGATFPYPVYSQWAYKYERLKGMKLNYQSIGSGGGIAQIKAKTVDFGASDAPMKEAELSENGLIQDKRPFAYACNLNSMRSAQTRDSTCDHVHLVGIRDRDNHIGRSHAGRGQHLGV